MEWLHPSQPLERKRVLTLSGFRNKTVAILGIPGKRCQLQRPFGGVFLLRFLCASVFLRKGRSGEVVSNVCVGAFFRCFLWCFPLSRRGFGARYLSDFQMAQNVVRAPPQFCRVSAAIRDHCFPSGLPPTPLQQKKNADQIELQSTAFSEFSPME